jgi:hypothetical protein
MQCDVCCDPILPGQPVRLAGEGSIMQHRSTSPRSRHEACARADDDELTLAGLWPIDTESKEE